MNKVFISGVITENPLCCKEKDENEHLILNLSVRHRTKAGDGRKEIYRISAWNNTAKWGATNLAKGQLIAVQGYLTQRQVSLGSVTAVLTEITAEEFLSVHSHRYENSNPEHSEVVVSDNPSGHIATAQSE